MSESMERVGSRIAALPVPFVLFPCTSAVAIFDPAKEADAAIQWHTLRPSYSMSVPNDAAGRPSAGRNL